MRRRCSQYRRTSDSYRALIRYIGRQQGKNGVSPGSIRECSRAIGISHTQARRLIDKAEQAGILRKRGSDALAYDVVLNPPTSAGLAWIPRTKCTWRKPICWSKDDADGVWLDRAVYRIKNEEGLWAVTFVEANNEGRGAKFCLDQYALALVRRCSKGEAIDGCWYLIEYKGEVYAAYLSKREKQGDTVRWTFRLNRTDKEALCFNEKRIKNLAEIEMITMQPPGPKRHLKRRDFSI